MFSSSSAAAAAGGRFYMSSRFNVFNMDVLIRQVGSEIKSAGRRTDTLCATNT